MLNRAGGRGGRAIGARPRLKITMAHTSRRTAVGAPNIVAVLQPNTLVLFHVPRADHIDPAFALTSGLPHLPIRFDTDGASTTDETRLTLIVAAASSDSRSYYLQVTARETGAPVFERGMIPIRRSAAACPVPQCIFDTDGTGAGDTATSRSRRTQRRLRCPIARHRGSSGVVPRVD
ncbi:hypothetical protein EI94DRAFT_1733350 [Lactarius quietus]|nr:hypothetical protein EI94DRAFT_1733350 [Lactarius quietus]